jgi:DnaJ-class molecular chaperone
MNNLMSLQTFGFIEARKNNAGKLLIKFLITPEQRAKQVKNEIMRKFDDFKMQLKTADEVGKADIVNKVSEWLQTIK